MTAWRPGQPGEVPFALEDPRSPDQLAKDQRRVRRQLINLERRASDEAVRRELLNQVRRRRADREDMVQFVPLPGPDGYDLLVAEGELLIRTEHADDASVANFLGEYPGLVREDPDDDLDVLDGRVTRYRYQHGAEAYTVQRLNDIAHFLRQRGVQVTLNSVIPLGPVGKALAGPEPSAGSRPWTGGPDGEIVAVIDTGVSYEQRTDQWLQSPPVERDGTNEDRLTDIDGTYLNFAAGHGTLVAGIIQQVEPGARIKMHKSLDGDGFGKDTAVAAAMVRAVRDGARILNLSLGTRTPGQNPPIGMQTALEIIREETGDETVIVAAAGNYGNTERCWPAAFRRVVSVAGLTVDGLASNWSTRGPDTTVSTISEGVLSTYVEGEESWLIDWDPDIYDLDSWAMASGTSFGAPQVAGAIARICREQSKTPREALGILLGYGRPIPDFGLALRILPGT
jgi:Subtilase family